MFHHNKGGTKPAMKGDSAKTFLSVGSGSRPTKGKHGIKTSAPDHAHKIGRKPAGALR